MAIWSSSGLPSGSASRHAKSEGSRVKILRSTYADFVPTLATEKLRTKHGHAGERRARCAGWSAVRRYIQPRNILIVKMANPSSDSFASDRDRFVCHDLRPHS